MTTLTFNDVNFHPVTQNGQLWITSAELAKALDYSQSDAVTKIYNRNKDEFSENMTQVIENPHTPNLGVRIFSLRGCHLIAMFAKTKIAKLFRVWVLDILDKEIRTDSKQREVLRQACEKLATGNMLISDAYILVGKQFGYDDGIKNIPTPLLPEAVAFVYEMILRLQKQPTNDNSDYNALWRKIGLLEYHRHDDEMRKFRSNLEQLVRQFNVLHKTKGLIYDALMEQKVNCTTDPAEINAKAEAFIDKQLAMKF